MARRFRRRKPRVVWLNNEGGLQSTGGLDASGQNSFLTFGVDNADVSPLNVPDATAVVDIPLVLDNDSKEFAEAGSLATWQDQTLADAQSLGYRLRRIVGSLWAFAAPSTDQAITPSLLMCGAGLIIRRVASDTGAPALVLQERDVLGLGNIRDPWIWRRTWIINPVLSDPAGASSPSADDGLSDFRTGFNETNAFFTGPNGTPTVDQKTARNIGPEERLFLSVSWRALGFAPNTGDTVKINWRMVFDYRVLASIRTNAGNKRNATR